MEECFSLENFLESALEIILDRPFTLNEVKAIKRTELNRLINISNNLLQDELDNEHEKGREEGYDEACDEYGI